jgi:hypothetical protein
MELRRGGPQQESERAIEVQPGGKDKEAGFVGV